MKSSGQILLRFDQFRSAHFSLPIRKKTDPAGTMGIGSSDKKHGGRPDRETRHRHR